MQNRMIPEIIDSLRRTDTCTVSNAIETFQVRMRNDGFVHDAVRCFFPELPPVAGYAVTGRIRTTAPPIAGLCYYQRMDWWEYVKSVPSPKIIVMEDADRTPGVGALFGEIHARIAQQLGCVAYVSNGTVRDIAQIKDTGMQCFASGSSVSHSYAHVVDFSEPIEIGGLKICSGDLLHGDLNGIQNVPWEIADRLPARVNEIISREAQLLELARSADFTLEKLAALLNPELPLCPPLRHS